LPQQESKAARNGRRAGSALALENEAARPS